MLVGGDQVLDFRAELGLTINYTIVPKMSENGIKLLKIFQNIPKLV